MLADIVSDLLKSLSPNLLEYLLTILKHRFKFHLFSTSTFNVHQNALISMYEIKVMIDLQHSSII